MFLSVVRGLCWPRSVDRLLFHLNLCRKWQSAKTDKNRPAGRKPTGRRFEVFCCLFTWYSSYSWPEYPCGGARLFLSGRSGLDHSDSKTAWRCPPVGRHAFNWWKWTERKRQRSRETSLETLPLSELDTLCTTDQYPSDSFIFPAYGCELQISDGLVATAFASLPQPGTKHLDTALCPGTDGRRDRRGGGNVPQRRPAAQD